MRQELFEVGSYDYSDLDDRLTKPVNWTEDDLKLIAENYRGGIPLTSEHDNIYVGIGNNIEYEEGKLFIEILMNWIWNVKAYLLKLMSY